MIQGTTEVSDFPEKFNALEERVAFLESVLKATTHQNLEQMRQDYKKKTGWFAPRNL